MRSKVRNLFVGLVCGLLLLAGLASAVATIGASQGTAAASVPQTSSVTPALSASTMATRTLLPSVIPLAAPASTPAPRAPLAATGAPSSASSVGITPTAAAPASPVIRESWTGLKSTDNGFLTGYPNVAPPDVQVAVGPNHVVEMVNFAVSIWTKQGTWVHNESLMSFFRTPSTEFISDPKVQYDASSGRWFASVTDVATGSLSPTGRVLLAVSATSDPTGYWRIVGVPSAATGECLDQPILGVGGSTVIESVNVFSSCLSNKYTYNGAQYWVLNKAELVANASSPAMQSFGPYANTASFHPAQVIGSSSVDYLVSANADLASVNSIEYFRVSGAPPAASVSASNLSVRSIISPPPATQPGGGGVLPLDTGDFRVQDAAWSAGNLWLSLSDSCTPAGDSQARACVRLMEINTTTGTVTQDFDIGAAGRYYFYPALRADARGNLLVVYGYSSSKDYPGLMAAGRVFGDPLDGLDPPIILVAGTADESLQCSSSAGTCRYGDYFGAALDPSDASVVWAAGEFGAPSGWRTQIFSGSVKAVLTFDYGILYGGSGYTLPTVSYTLDGTTRSVNLSLAPTSYAADPSTDWNVSVLLGRPNVVDPTSEVWFLNATLGAPPFSGKVTTSLTESFTYYHMYLFDFGFSTSDNAAVSAPMIQAQEWGIRFWLAAGASHYVDAGSSFIYPNLLNGSTAQERWALSGPANGTAAGPNSFAGLYYHQYRVTFDYLLEGGAAGPAPAVHYSSLGASASVTANATVWADAARPYAFDASLTDGNGTERTGAGVGATGNVTSAGTITVTYRIQYLLRVFAEPSPLLANVSGAGWYDLGSVATLTAVAPSGWQFIGWSGSLSSASSSATITMDGPASVTALFYPGLTIVAGAGGSVAYAYGSVSGVVAAGSSKTIYAPAGTAVTLTALPSSSTDGFVSWGGEASGSAGSTTLTLSGPATVSATFGANALVLAGVAGGVIAVILALLVLVLFARRRRKQPPA